MALVQVVAPKYVCECDLCKKRIDTNAFPDDWLRINIQMGVWGMNLVACNECAEAGPKLPPREEWNPRNPIRLMKKE